MIALVIAILVLLACMCGLLVTLTRYVGELAELVRFLLVGSERGE